MKAEKSKSSHHHCMVVHAYYPYGETRVEREAIALTNHGIKVDVLCLQRNGDTAEETINGIRVYRMPVKRNKEKGMIAQLWEYFTFFVFALIKLISLQVKNHYNVIQVHNLPDWLVFSAQFPKLAGARVILDLHDLMPEFYSARFDKSMTSGIVRLIAWQEKVSCMFADHVITVTEGWRETIIKRGVPPTKVSVVMNVPDDRIFSSSGYEGKKEYHSGQLNLLYHGNLTHRYGMDLAVRAVRQVIEHIPGIHLHIHGQGDVRQSLIDLTKTLGLDEYVSFNQHALLTEELPGLIQQADICLVPYRRDIFTDGILPTKLMEYAALGKPVITVRTPTISRYFDDSMVQFFEAGDENDLARVIISLYDHPERLKELAEGTRKFNSQYNWTKIGSEYVGLVERLGGRGKMNHAEAIH